MHYVLENPDLYGVPETVHMIKSERVLIQMVQKGIGNILVPRTWARFYSQTYQDLVVLPVRDSVYFDCGIIYNQDTVFSPAVNTFIHELTRCVEQELTNK